MSNAGARVAYRTYAVRAPRFAASAAYVSLRLRESGGPWPTSLVDPATRLLRPGMIWRAAHANYRRRLHGIDQLDSVAGVLADGDPAKGNFLVGSPLAFAIASRRIARYRLGQAR